MNELENELGIIENIENLKTWINKETHNDSTKRAFISCMKGLKESLQLKDTESLIPIMSASMTFALDNKNLTKLNDIFKIPNIDDHKISSLARLLLLIGAIGISMHGDNNNIKSYLESLYITCPINEYEPYIDSAIKDFLNFTLDGYKEIHKS
jgi:hypothetical protein